MAVTLKQIATSVGLSQPAVSNILNAKGHLYRPETRKKVLDAAQHLGYRANAAAKATATGRFDCIALLLSTLTHRSSVFGGLFDGIHDALSSRGQHLTLARLPDEQLVDAGYVPKILKQWFADGLLINYNAQIPASLVMLLREHKIPSIWMNSRQDANSIYPDDDDAARRATQQLLELGHRRIIHVNYSGGDHYSALARYAGYKQAMQSAGQSPVSVFGPVDRIDRIAHAQSWLAADDRPTAVVAYASTSAWPIREAAMSLGLQVPRDLSVITFEEQLSNDIGIAIDTMILPEKEMGCQAVEMLMQRIDTPGEDLPNRALRFDLQSGQTVSPPLGV